MKQEIGGYLELEVFHGKEYYPDLVKVNLGRTALCWLLESRKIETLYLPFFLCDSVIDACRRQGTHVNFYSLNEDLTPVLSPELSLHPGEYLYLVNYYGQLTDEKILHYKKHYKNIIVDHTHAFYQRPLPGVDTLYSCRKFFGLSDGAYLSTDAALTAGKDRDVSAERMGHILGRFEKDAGTYYQKMLDNAATYHQMKILTMSRLTQNLLKAIDYEQIRQKRNENYRLLKELLPSDSPFTRVTPDGPFAYPYYHKNGIALRKALAKEKIFVPTNWSNVIRDCAPESYEYQWAADILPLPCDQRYGNEEMQRIADVIHSLEPSLASCNLERTIMNKRLLILGTLGEFEQLVQKARARGIYTIVCDGYPDGPARAFADESYVIPVTDTDRIAALCKEKQVDGILTSFSDLLLECMVKISAKAGLPCYLSPEQLPWYRDKSATRRLLEELGLPSPGFAKIPTFGFAPELVAHLHFPLVTKPLDKYGSRGIYVVHNLEELKQAITETASFTDLPEILVEEYNDGYEFNMMTWVHKGKVHVISIADREKTDIGPGEIPISTRNVYPSCLYEQVVAPATALLQCYADKTGQKEGALSMQFFWKPENGIQVCEIAARFFGYEHELTDMVYGFSIEDLLLNYLYDVPALEQMLDQHDPRKPICHGAVLYFQGRLLQIRDLSVPQKLASHSAVEKPWIFYHEGEYVIAHGPNPYVALYYISCPSRKELDQVTGEFFASMTIPSSDGKEVLYRNQMPDYPKTK